MTESAKLFDRPWRFVTGAPSLASLPPEGPLEVAFAGRSNVGKSSLINALTGQKGLARTSNTPGRTQHLNFFVPDDGGDVLPAIAIVDMPGYGFAKAPKAQVEAWTRLIRAYLRGRASLRRVFVLIDARHGIKPNDEDVLSLLDKAAVSYQIVLTKADKLKPPALRIVVQDTLEQLRKRPAAFPEIVVTSAEKRSGIDELRDVISGLLDN
jgi:GTP-binding protein